MDRRPWAFVTENYQFVSGAIVCDFHFRHNLLDFEVNEVVSLLSLLVKIYLSKTRKGFGSLMLKVSLPLSLFKISRLERIVGYLVRRAFVMQNGP